MFWLIWATVFLLFLLYKTIFRVLGLLVSVHNRQNKAVLISGCDTGFGHVAALAFADMGVHVFAGCLTEEGETKLRKLRPDASNLHIVSLNITSDISVNSAKEKVSKTLLSKGLTLWALVNNAGIEVVNGPDDILTVDHYQKHMDVNLYGTIRLTQAFKDLIKASSGRLVFVTSIKARLAFPECGPYTCTKWALEAYLDTIRREVADFGVTVHVVEPGGFKTSLIGMVPENFKAAWSRAPAATRAEYGEEFFQDRLSALESWSSDTQEANLEPVAEAYAQAVYSRFPRYRYVVGWDCWLWPGYLWVSYLPEALQDLWFDHVMMRSAAKPATVHSVH